MFENEELHTYTAVIWLTWQDLYMKNGLPRPTVKKGIFTEKSLKLANSYLRQTINRKCGINLTKPYTVIAGLRVAQQALEISLASGLQRETTGARRRIDLLRELDNHRRHPPEVTATL